MTLREFAKELEKISKSVTNSNEIEVEMADCISVVKPIYKNGIVYITDIEPEI